MFHFNKLTAETVPAFAGRDLGSGQLFGMFNVDIKYQLDACMADDQKLSDDSNALIMALKNEDWDKVASIDEDIKNEWTADLTSDVWASCDEDVHAAFSTAAAFYEEFFAQENW
jgi:hypothetical protein